MKLEQELARSEILERYLNTIYFGRGAYGVQAAVAGLLRQGRRRARPARGRLPRRPDPRARSGRALHAPRGGEAPPPRPSLDAMVEEGMITTAERRRGRRRGRSSPFHGLAIWTRRRASTSKGVDLDAARVYAATQYFIEAVRKQTGAAVRRGHALRRRPADLHDARPRTCRQAACDAVTATLTSPDDPAGALVAVDDQGQVKAMVGGRDFDDAEGQPRHRQAGAAARVASRARRSSRSRWPRRSARASRSSSMFNVAVGDRASRTANGGEDWTVATTGAAAGVPTSSTATEKSVNTAYAQLMLELGAENVVEHGPRRSGVDAPTSTACAVRSCSARATCRRSTWPPAYSTFANHGVRIDAPDRSPGSSGPTAPCSTRRARRATQVLDRRAGRPGHLLPCSRSSRRGTGRGGQLRPARGRQDRHDPGQRRRLVRRLHAEAHRRGVDGLPRRAHRADGRRPRHRGGARAARSRRRSGGKFMERGHRRHRHRARSRRPRPRTLEPGHATSNPRARRDHAAAADHRDRPPRPSPARRPPTTTRRRPPTPATDHDAADRATRRPTTRPTGGARRLGARRPSWG